MRRRQPQRGRPARRQAHDAPTTTAGPSRRYLEIAPPFDMPPAAAGRGRGRRRGAAGRRRPATTGGQASVAVADYRRAVAAAVVQPARASTDTAEARPWASLSQSTFLVAAAFPRERNEVAPP